VLAGVEAPQLPTPGIAAILRNQAP